MRKIQWLAVVGLALSMAVAPEARAQSRPYIGFVYPAGGQQGTTFHVKLGGQGMEDIDEVLVTGKGVSAKVVEYHRKIGPQDMQLLGEQLRELRRGSRRGTALASVTAPSSSSGSSTTSGDAMMDSMTASGKTSGSGAALAPPNMITRIEKRMGDYVQRPACSSIASLVYIEVTIAASAPPGERELRLGTARGVSNPMAFHVGQVPELSRKPMTTAHFQVLGKEELALRKRPPEEIEDRIRVPCTVNGQIASGEENRYRFSARKGQRLVISTLARQLIPYIADAVPGWFQPVLALYDANGKEVAFDDDYRFRPDPMIFYEVPKDGEYVFSITDAIFRGREDFVYRITIGEEPFVTSIFPLGGRVGEPVSIRTRGWNLDGAQVDPPSRDAKPGIQMLAARAGKLLSNRVPFALDNLPETFDKEPNNDPAHAQKVKTPVIVNGRIDRPDDWDVFQVWGRAGETIVAEVMARRLDSPLDSVLKITDASGKVLALNDDHEDAGAGTNTHDADSYLMVKLPADGTYYIHVGDTARCGGEEYAYRLRISAPRPDFALRVVPSSVSMRNWGSSQITVYAIRKDGFSGKIKLALKDPPAGLSANTVTMSANEPSARIGFKAGMKVDSKRSFTLTVEGRAQVGDWEIVRLAVPAEDRMQAFLWRHLVPANDLKLMVFNPSYDPPPKRVPRPVSTVATKPVSTASGEKPKFTKQQVAGRLRQLKGLFEEGLLTDEFYAAKVAECETPQ